MKLNEKMIKLEENVSILLASNEHAETELMRVEKSMLKEIYDTCSSPIRPLFLHALSFECTSKLCVKLKYNCKIYI